MSKWDGQFQNLLIQRRRKKPESITFAHLIKKEKYEMSHKNFRAIYTNRDENFYGEFHLTKKQ
jgi:hypothetical protein